MIRAWELFNEINALQIIFKFPAMPYGFLFFPAAIARSPAFRAAFSDVAFFATTFFFMGAAF